MTNPDSPDSGWLKHMEFIQAVITRLANDSFLMKGWALTVAGAFYGFAVKETSWRVAAIGLMPVLIFWGLDASPFARKGCSAVSMIRSASAAQELSHSDERRSVCVGGRSWGRTLLSRTLAPFYGPVFIVGIPLTAILS